MAKTDRRRNPRTADELEQYIKEQLLDAEGEKVYRGASLRQQALSQRMCRHGNCIEYYDPDTGVTESGYGPVGCPCQEET